MSHKILKEYETAYIDDGNCFGCSACHSSWIEPIDDPKPFMFCPHCGVSLVKLTRRKRNQMAARQAVYNAMLKPVEWESCWSVEAQRKWINPPVGHPAEWHDASIIAMPFLLEHIRGGLTEKGIPRMYRRFRKFLLSHVEISPAFTYRVFLKRDGKTVLTAYPL